MENQEDEKDKIRKGTQNYMKYSGMAIQMGVIILIGTYSGMWLDEKFQTNTPWFTVGLALLSIFAALYVSLKDLFTNK
ncbi:AtpZ/AtpI family protein [Flavilitoribacter nigricans]|nr:AtpZ/AtpI family protein [Flavilitoribacter nigricans]